MNLQEWRSKQTEQITLPSGLGVTVKRVSLLDMVVNGTIPAPLLTQVQALSAGAVTVKIDQIGEYADAINAVVRACVMEPPIADEPDDTHLGIQEIPFEERVEIFKWANQKAMALAPFRAKPAGDVEPAQPGGDVPAPA